MNGVLLPFAAVAAGVLSATSPCVLPVLPGYLAAVSATDTAQLGTDRLASRPRVLGARVASVEPDHRLASVALPIAPRPKVLTDFADYLTSNGFTRIA